MRRFILCAAESGIDVFRLHDPLNDADDLAAAAGAVREAGGRLYAGLVYADGPGGDDFLVGARQGAWAPSAPIACCCTTRPARSTRPASATW